MSKTNKPLLKTYLHVKRPKPDCDSDSENMAGNNKSVKFDSQTIETSFGGTKTPGRLRESVMKGSKVGVNPLASVQQLTYSPVVKDTGKNDPSSMFFNVSSPQKNFQEPTVAGKFTSSRRSLQASQFASTPECFSKVHFETPQSTRRRTLQNTNINREQDLGEENSITVAVRVRPFAARERSDPNLQCVVEVNGNQTTVSTLTGQQHDFAFNYSFWSFDKTHHEFADQEHVYTCLAQPLLGKALEGYNTCLFAYGQTGSGKSYTMMGQNKEVGIIPRFSEELFARTDSLENVAVHIEISYFEIYNEKIHDLLASSSRDSKSGLKVREHPTLGPYVEGLSTYVVNSYSDIQTWINLGNKQRATAATGMNDKSSRSHSVFTIVMTQTRSEEIQRETHEHSVTSRINLVDLAGSERQSLAQTSGERLREGSSINKSLLALGKVIAMLSEQSTVASSKKKKLFIPYRDSVLTWLLKESLGGNSKTAMIATISPSNLHMEDTLSTLRYALQASNIVNTARVNEDSKAKIIRELREEIERLKCLKSGETDGEDFEANLAGMEEIESLKERLLQQEKEMRDATRTWQEKLRQSEQKKQAESRLLEKSGITLKIDNSLPNLVNLNEDPQLSEMLLYVLKDGTTKVGRMTSTSSHDIQLHGALIADDHCVIENRSHVMSISPCNEAPVYINGDMITETTVLHHGDRVILGGDHYFRLNHPQEKGRRSGGHVTQIKDFEFAKQELMRVQNDKLQAELDVARKEAEKARAEARQEQLNLRQKYEDKMNELENQLRAHEKERDLVGQQDRIKYQSQLDKLRTEKLNLEREVTSNRRRLEMEAAASKKAGEGTKVYHSKILGHLQKEKEKISEEVQRLAAIKKRREVNSLPGTPRKQGGEKKDLYKIALHLREANKISQDLKKHTVFCREDINNSDLVKVTNTKLGISTFWMLDKFEERLVRMRELYQGETEGFSDDEVFYDFSDPWEKTSRVLSPGDSSKLLLRVRQQEKRSGCLRESLASFSSSVRSGSVTSSKASYNSDTESDMDTGSPPVMAICRDFVRNSMQQFGDGLQSESEMDRILHQCETIKLSTVTMLDAYEQSDESRMNRRSFLHSDVIQLGTLQITMATNLLMHHVGLYAAVLDGMLSEYISELRLSILTTTKKIGTHTMLFLQGCESDIDSMVHESAAQILDGVFALCKFCGELTLATDTDIMCLSEYEGHTSVNTASPTLGHDIRQSFVSGCDVFLDKTLQGAVKGVEGSKFKMQTFSDNRNRKHSKISAEVLEQAEIVSATTHILLLKIQSAQIDIDTSVRESLMAAMSDGYYHQHYLRSQRLIGQVATLVDSVQLMTKATENLVSDKESDVSKLQKCAEMIIKSSSKLHTASNTSELDDSNTSLLSETQKEELDYVTSDVRRAADRLIQLVQARTVPGKTRRMLPRSPEKPSTLDQTDTPLKHKTIRKQLALVERMETT